MSDERLPEFSIAGRWIGPAHPPFVIAEIGINHGGDVDKAKRMLRDAHAAGADCAKIQSHLPEAEMVPNDVVPGNETRSIWDVISESTMTWEQEKELFDYAASLGLLLLSTPFSREAADHLAGVGVPAFKIGSGECNNYPLIDHVASFGRPMIVSTGMNDIASIAPAVEAMRARKVPFALLHCTSLYPTPPSAVRLGALDDLRTAFPDAVLGLSDHTLTNHPAVASVALGASIIERHFTSDMGWPGPDIEISMNPQQLADLVTGCRVVWEAGGGSKQVLAEEQPTIDFAFASVVAVRDIPAGARVEAEDVWVKRPGTGGIPARHLFEVIGRETTRALSTDDQVSWTDLR